MHAFARHIEGTPSTVGSGLRCVAVLEFAKSIGWPHC